MQVWCTPSTELAGRLLLSGGIHATEVQDKHRMVPLLLLDEYRGVCEGCSDDVVLVWGKKLCSVERLLIAEIL